MNYENQKLPQRLKEALAESKYSTRKLGEKVGVTGATISRYTSGIMQPKIGTVRLMAEVLGVNDVWLLGGDIDKYAPIQEEKPATEKQQAVIDLAMELNDRECELLCKIIFDVLSHRLDDK